MRFNTIAEYHENFVDVGFDRRGVFSSMKITAPDNFNFAYDIIDKFAEMEPNRPALVWTNGADERRFTYGDLSRLSNQAANLFAAEGIKKGDKVMLVLKRHYQFWFALLGLMKLGAVAIPATHLLTEKDFSYRFKNAEVVGIVATGANPEVAEYVDLAEKELGVSLKAKLIANGEVKQAGWKNFDELIDSQPDTFQRVENTADDMVLLYFTSGTTGYPKMVTHGHRYSLSHLQSGMWQNLQPDSLHLTIADTGWAKAVWGKFFPQFLFGAQVFVYDFERFVAEDILRVIEKFKVTSFCAPPTMYRFFIQEDLSKYDLSALKYTTTAGEALNPEVFEKWKKQTGKMIMEGFGQTETVIMLANLPGTTPKPGSLGKPLPLYNIDLVDADGNSVKDGENGEIIMRETGNGRKSDGFTPGYYKNSEMDDKLWEGGVFHTGDVAWRDEDGFYWYVGRNDDVIKSSGYRIGPFEVESVLMTHPAVLECAVTGADDPVRGKVVKATIILTKGYAPSPELAKELQAHVKKNTAPYKYPRIVQFVDELPKTISGKIKRAEIRERDNSN
ncbi:MAG: AMP-binding protein [Oscillospiraceae bacterium]|jgi:acetyl-CoA synthetase|nr:AMP-binding protein [Oscillospiraceae bacterium]